MLQAGARRGHLCSVLLRQLESRRCEPLREFLYFADSSRGCNAKVAHIADVLNEPYPTHV